jgi:hypothetical protein
MDMSRRSTKTVVRRALVTVTRVSLAPKSLKRRGRVQHRCRRGRADSNQRGDRFQWGWDARNAVRPAQRDGRDLRAARYEDLHDGHAGLSRLHVASPATENSGSAAAAPPAVLSGTAFDIRERSPSITCLCGRSGASPSATARLQATGGSGGRPEAMRSPFRQRPRCRRRRSSR